MRWKLPVKSLRFRLVLASVVVEVFLLALLVTNSQRLITESLLHQGHVRTQELNTLFNAALAGPLAARDYATIADLLHASRRKDGVDYLLLLNYRGDVVASEGWDSQDALPPLDIDVAASLARGLPNFNTETPITLAGQRYGTLRYGLSTEFLRVAKSSLLRQSLLIAAAEVTLSIVLLSAIGIWLTRHLALLRAASRDIAAGDFNVRMPVRSEDEIGELTAAFNTMSQAVRDKLTELDSSRALFHSIADYTYDWESWLDTRGELLWVNASVERITGYTVAECMSTQDYPYKFIFPDDVAVVRRMLGAPVRDSRGSDLEFRIQHKKGSLLWASMSWQPIYTEQGELLGRRTSVRDVTERKQMELALERQITALEESEEYQKRLMRVAQQEQARMAQLLAAMNLGILFEDVENRVVYMNPAFRRMWLIREGLDIIGKPTRDVMEHSASMLARPDHFSRHILEVLATNEVSDAYEVALADGRVVTQLSYPVRDSESRFIGRLWVCEDVTHERQTAEQLVYLAERDSLTGLYNRHRFQQELGRLLADAHRRQLGSALLFFDLDEFKYINDTFGHRAGDTMLIRVASEVGALIRHSEILSRLGGDEFAVLMPGAEPKDAEQLAERIVRAIAQIPFRFEQHNLRLTGSVGIALYPEHGTSAEELVSHADAAMYQAKESGKNAWRFYRPEDDSSREMLGRLSWQERIGNALETGLFRLHYQGIYDAAGGQLQHLEVLVRMIDQMNPQEIIMPGHFIGIAEKTGMIRGLDRWVIEKSVGCLAASTAVPPLAVNISGRSFDDPSLPQFISDTLRRYKVAPRRLYVELTETSAVTDLHDAQRFIQALRQTGCVVCLDDFGTGFSSFAYLKYLNVDILKIDGLFIRDLPNDRDNQVFVKSIVDVARGMRKITVAEFVEDENTWAMLKAMGVDMVQGYHLDMPRASHPAVPAGCGG